MIACRLYSSRISILTRVAILTDKSCPTERRVARETDRLLTTLDGASVAVTGELVFLGYDVPWTLPFLGRSEVVVEVEPNEARDRIEQGGTTRET
jgi:hypothetical protein